jgi:hypothetical protein
MAGKLHEKKQKKNSAILFSFWLWLQNVILLFLLHTFYQLFRLGFQENHGRCYEDWFLVGFSDN